MSDQDREDGMVRNDCVSKNRVEFPYYHLRDYLEQRNLHYLAVRIPWTYAEPESRTKHFINALKIRILASAPHAYSVIARNEAHIRLSSSLWYVCFSLLIASGLGIAVAVLCAVTAYTLVLDNYNFLILQGIVPIVVSIMSYVAMRSIEKSFHYQRAREILHILELARWMEFSGLAKGIFDGLAPISEDMLPVN